MAGNRTFDNYFDDYFGFGGVTAGPGEIVVIGHQAYVPTIVDCSPGTIHVSTLPAQPVQIDTSSCHLLLQTESGSVSLGSSPQGRGPGYDPYYLLLNVCYDLTCNPGTVTVSGLQADVEQVITQTVTSDAAGAVEVSGPRAEVPRTVPCSAGTIEVTGPRGGIGQTVTCSAGEITVSGLKGNAWQPSTLDCSEGTIAVSGVQGGIGQTVTCVAGTIEVTGLQAGISQTVACEAGTIAISGQQSDLGNAQIVTSLAPGAIAVAGPRAEIPRTVPCAAGTLEVSGLLAEIVRTVGCAAGTVHVSGQKATPNNFQIVWCSPGAIAVSGLQATVEQYTTQEVDCDAGAITVSGVQTSSITQSFPVQCDVGSLAVQGLQGAVIVPVNCLTGTIVVEGKTATIPDSGTPTRCNTWVPDADGRTWHPEYPPSRTWHPEYTCKA